MKKSPAELRIDRQNAAARSAQAQEEEPRSEASGPRRFTAHYMEEIIQEAIKRGEFDNLPGKGKPLDFSDDPDPYDKNGSWMVNHILRNANVAPEWVELDKEIRADLGWLQSHPANHPERRSRVIELNDKIMRYNLCRPSTIYPRPRYKE